MSRALKGALALVLALVAGAIVFGYCSRREGASSAEDEYRKQEQAMIDAAVERAVEREAAAWQRAVSAIERSAVSSGSFQNLAAQPIRTVTKLDTSSVAAIRLQYQELAERYYALLESGQQAVADCDSVRTTCVEARQAARVTVDSLKLAVKIRDDRLANPPPAGRLSVGVTAGYGACAFQTREEGWQLRSGPAVTLGGSYRFFGGGSKRR